jgi:RNA polymerase sigma factor (sigma-70 family)
VTLKRVVIRPSAKRTVAVAGNNLATVLAFPVPHSDIGLVRGLRAGKLDALRVLCERYGSDLLCVGMRVLGPDVALQAMVVEGVLRALYLLEQLDNPRELRRWLVTHLIAVIRKRLRSRRRWGWLSRFCHAAMPSLEMKQLGGYSEQLITTYRLLGRLNVDERIVLTLSTFGGMEPSELATVLGTSVARVRRLLKRAEAHFERLSDG